MRQSSSDKYPERTKTETSVTHLQNDKKVLEFAHDMYYNCIARRDDMDTNMTFRMDSDVKNQMAAICEQLGMTTSTAFNIFANAFVRAKGMPFTVALQEPVEYVTRERMLADTSQILAEFASDYKRMAE